MKARRERSGFSRPVLGRKDEGPPGKVPRCPSAKVSGGGAYFFMSLPSGAMGADEVVVVLEVSEQAERVTREMETRHRRIRYFMR